MENEYTTHGGIIKFFGNETSKNTIADVIYKSLTSKDVPDASKKILAMQFMWIWSEFDNKFIGCPYWSKHAIEYFEDVIKSNYKDHEFLTANNKLRSDWKRVFQVKTPNKFNDKPNKSNNKNKPTLTHEHAIPKSFACQKLLEAKLNNEKEVHNFMEDHARGVIITELERDKIDSKFKSTMPDENKYTWLDRYEHKAVSIKVYKVKWEEFNLDNKEISLPKEEIDQSKIKIY